MNENEKTEVQEHKTEVVFKEKFGTKVKNFAKKNGKLIGGIAVGVATTAAGFVLGKKFLSKNDACYTSWTDEDGGSHVAFQDGSTNVEVIETPM